MGKKRKPISKQNKEPKGNNVPEEDEIPEGFAVLNPNDFAKQMGVKPSKKERRRRDPLALLNAQPWKKLDTNDLQFLSDAPQMLTLEELDGSFYDQLFVREEEQQPAKKQKITHDQDDQEQSDSDESDKETFKKVPMFLAPSVMNKKKQKEEEKFKYILAPKKNGDQENENDETEDQEEIYDEEDDYELEDDDKFNINISGVLEDDDYSDDENNSADSTSNETINFEQWPGADTRIIQALSDKLSIKTPTPCQHLVLPAALVVRQDILLAAPTVRKFTL